ncbi:MAG: hypothetical protein IH859_05400 [Chloroflexi bacterium]|nr:hypothetical protein [Chloroflexota bacterium]
MSGSAAGGLGRSYELMAGLIDYGLVAGGGGEGCSLALVGGAYKKPAFNGRRLFILAWSSDRLERSDAQALEEGG